MDSDKSIFIEYLCKKILDCKLKHLSQFDLNEVEFLKNSIVNQTDFEEIRKIVPDEIALNLYKEYTLEICNACSSNISDFYIDELLYAIKEVVCEAIFNISSNLMNMDVHIDSITHELCPLCEKEVKLNNEFIIQACPSCNKDIKPCSMCDMDIHKCSNCPLDK